MTYLQALSKLTFACSALLIGACAFSSDLTEFRKRVDAAGSAEKLNEALTSASESVTSDLSLSDHIGYSLDCMADCEEWEDHRSDLLDVIDGRLAFEAESASGTVDDPEKAARDILSSPLYVDKQRRKDSNWLDNALMRVGKALVDWLDGLLPKQSPAIGNVGLPGLGGLTVVAWFILGAIVILIVFFIVRNYRGAGQRRKRVGGILDDDEPDRTAEQWLEQASALEAQGRYREAVRCLYIACLVQYDEGRIARFRRHETNWEHLYRIEASIESPRSIDFRSATQKFDKVWYGYMVKGHEDVAEFREVYKLLCEALKAKAVA